MLDNLKKYKIFLASKSPRRQEILKMLRIPFTVITIPGIDESFPSDLPLQEIPSFISQKKADAYMERLVENDLIITADTMVICDNRIIGKPKDAEEAKEMLSFLSGKTHQVATGVSISTHSKRKTFTSISDVTFATLTKEEIEYYVDNFSPLDKAGAYGIQEWIGGVAVSSIEGSFYNVVGLPVHRLYSELKKF